MPRACAKAGELFSRRSSRFFHLRLHQPFLPAPASFASARLNRLALPCLSAIGSAQTYLLSPGAQLIPRVKTWPALSRQVDVRSLVSSFFATGYDPLIAVALTPSDLGPLAISFAADAAAQQPPSHRAAPDLGRAERLMSNQIWIRDGSR